MLKEIVGQPLYLQLMADFFNTNAIHFTRQTLYPDLIIKGLVRIDKNMPVGGLNSYEIFRCHVLPND
jgi:hypothetical protein